ncbi:hypothetical protein E5676_scaffold16G00150 [Cucumis melo var. makuwa]|uniref:Reverse transcriptase Ty1/copia-type domain-containing protein n=1 Tax=Cucumis melo var. makuwa TaxID=1194695 RepID=A0A5A7UKJ1_CUCMM|nr:hypothetical protein E6C27_scaffold181G00160 [Cucumis melo var. makuwa]TYK09904.1 hypothetical protein E5676_scaffold16G00150 [Cucumis melo var. makuwa]
MDVKTAFLNDDLEEEIYMEQPEGFIVHDQESKVCKLDKPLYGLKQALKQWHEKLENLLMSKGFTVNESNKCIYYKTEGRLCIIICLYVDDMLIFGSNLHFINDVKSMLSANFDMKDLGETNNIGDSVNQSEYASIIGSLRYAADCTRPDIAYAVGLLCRFTSRPSLKHWNAIERVMRYLKKTQNLRLHYNKFPAVLEGGAVAWKSKKQTILAQLTMELEMIALATASEEASWLRSLL